MVKETHLAKHRKEYSKSELSKSDLPKDPIAGVKTWVDLAISEDVLEPTAMNLGTVNRALEPNVRTVLLKDIIDGEFVFYTNYESRKGDEIKAFENVCLHFFWPELQKQIRIKGIASKVGSQLSDTYFDMRPKESRIGACISPQSKKIESREELLEKHEQMMKLDTIKRPKNWGGYKIKPHYIEFWQGRMNRVHDRIVFEKEDTDWINYRIAP